MTARPGGRVPCNCLPAHTLSIQTDIETIPALFVKAARDSPETNEIRTGLEQHNDYELAADEPGSGFAPLRDYDI